MLVLEALAAKAFSRVADTKKAGGNAVRLLRDGNENYPLWLAAIAGAKTTVHLENYLIQEDPTGRSFADALIEAAGRGVGVRVIYDWLGCRSKTSAGFWERLRAAGVEVRCYNLPHLHSPLGWISRDHRKVLCVDGQIGFTGGLCIGQDWAGTPARRKAPWRDTAVEIRGPAVAYLEIAFADSWSATGAAMPPGEVPDIDKIAPAGDLGMLVIAGRPDSMGLYRLEQLIAETAERSLWLADAYFVATTGYVRALGAAARDGVDVRILVPGSSNIPIVRALSMSSYRPLIEAGVRVFEWNGPMMHAKTAVADGCWARVGSSNSNLSSWIANRELDVTIQDADFAKQMETMFERDLENAIEIVLDSGRLRSSVPRKLRPGAATRRGANASMWPRRRRARSGSRQRDERQPNPTSHPRRVRGARACGRWRSAAGVGGGRAGAAGADRLSVGAARRVGCRDFVSAGLENPRRRCGGP